MGKEKIKYSFDGQGDKDSGEVDFLVLLGFKSEDELNPVCFLGGNISNVHLASMWLAMEKAILEQTPELEDLLIDGRGFLEEKKEAEDAVDKLIDLLFG